jgi:hypothetical protein
VYAARRTPAVRLPADCRARGRADIVDHVRRRRSITAPVVRTTREEQALRKLRTWLRSRRSGAAGVLAASVLAASFVAAAAPAAAAGPALVPLVTFHNAARGDFFTTSQPGWTCQYFRTCPVDTASGYRAVGLQGHVFNPDNPQPAGTVPLFHWWSSARADNFLTSDPAWAGAIGDRKVSGDEYQLFRIEGYLSTTARTGSFPLRSYWNSAAADNAAIASWRHSSQIPGGYGQYRTEGFLLAPEAPSLTQCFARTLPDGTDTGWHARGNYVETWPAPYGLRNHDTLKIDATGVVRTDFWGTQEPVVGKASNPAPASWPAPGEPKHSLLGRVTRGAVYVANRGWYEANTWFPAVGTSDTRVPSPCVFYLGLFGPDLQVAINDDNLGDNGGFADVTIRHWQS